MKTATEHDIAAYVRLMDSFVPTHVGRFALIGNGDLVRVCDSYEEALSLGYARFKHAPFLVKEIVALDHGSVSRDAHLACHH